MQHYGYGMTVVRSTNRQDYQTYCCVWDRIISMQYKILKPGATLDAAPGHVVTPLVAGSC